jgi:hypothetical protein
MHSVRLLVAIALCLAVTLAQAAGFRFIDAPAVADGPPLKGAMWSPCWLPQRIEYARFQLGGIVVPVALDLPVYAGWCISVFGAPPLHRSVRLPESVVRSDVQRGGDAAHLRRRAFDVALFCETPSYLYSEFDRQLAVGTVGILLPIDKTLWPSVRRPSCARTKSQTLSSAPPKTFAISDCATFVARLNGSLGAIADGRRASG